MTAAAQPSLPAQTTGRHLGDLAAIAAIVICFFAAYMPTIGRQNFTNASENVVVQAALETRQGAPWWIPSMMGKPRILKPPYPTWVAAAAMTDNAIAATKVGDIAARDAAYHRLAAQVRWPSAMCSCLTLIAVYLLSKMIADRQVALAAVVICGSTVLLLRFGLMANTDVQLMMWVAWANVCLALAVLRGRWLTGCAGAGVCLGMAMMSKGPVGLLQSILPMAAFLLYARFMPIEGRNADAPLGRRIAAVAVGLLILLAIALPWPVSVMLTVPGAYRAWVTDVFSPAGTSSRPNHWWGYISMVPNLLPWVPLFLAGLCLPLFSRFRKNPIMLAWMLFVIPVIAQSFVRDKNERYGLPMVPAAAILCAFVAVHYLRNPRQMLPGDRIAIAAQWIIGFALAGAIFAGAIPIYDNPTRAWYGWTPAVLGGGAAILAMLLALRLGGRHRWIYLPATAVVSLIVFHLFIVGYAGGPAGSAEYKEVALKVAIESPGVEMLFYDPRPDPRHVPTDLAIYSGGIVSAVKRDALLTPATRPQVLFTIVPRHEEPTPFPGWSLWFENDIENRRFQVYRRPAREQLPDGQHD